jgi:hypothetical protein
VTTPILRDQGLALAALASHTCSSRVLGEEGDTFSPGHIGQHLHPSPPQPKAGCSGSNPFPPQHTHTCVSLKCIEGTHDYSHGAKLSLWWLYLTQPGVSEPSVLKPHLCANPAHPSWDFPCVPPGHGLP